MVDEDQMVQLKRDDLEALRNKAKQAEEMQQKLAHLERESAFARAGLDLSDKRAQYLARGYEGDLTPEAIRAEAIELGILKGHATNASPPKDELQAHDAMQAASGGDPSLPADFFDVMKNAKSAEEVMAAAAKMGHPTTWNRTV